MSLITIACLDMAGTTVADDGAVMSAFAAALERGGLAPGTGAHRQAIEIAESTMGQSKIEVFRRIFGDEVRAQRANETFEECYAATVTGGGVSPVPGATEVLTRLVIDLALSPADAGRGRPWPDLPLTALLRLGGGAVSELAVVGDTASDIESGLRAGAGLVAGVLTGQAGRDELTRAKAPVILDSVAELPSLLGLG